MNTFMAVYTAAYKGNLRAVKSFIKDGFDVNETLEDGYSLMHVAASNDDVALITYLSGAGAKIDKKDAYGRTPLSMAVYKGKSKATRALLFLGADPHEAWKGIGLLQSTLDPDSSAGKTLTLWLRRG